MQEADSIVHKTYAEISWLVFQVWYEIPYGFCCRTDQQGYPSGNNYDCPNVQIIMMPSASHSNCNMSSQPKINGIRAAQDDPAPEAAPHSAVPSLACMHMRAHIHIFKCVHQNSLCIRISSNTTIPRHQHQGKCQQPASTSIQYPRASASQLSPTHSHFASTHPPPLLPALFLLNWQQGGSWEDNTLPKYDKCRTTCYVLLFIDSTLNSFPAKSLLQKSTYLIQYLSSCLAGINQQQYLIKEAQERHVNAFISKTDKAEADLHGSVHSSLLQHMGKEQLQH